jgi:RsiW-degrading membrane proteinase PrsW (M82 family)
MGVLTVLVAAAPSLLLLVYFYLRDRFDREPLTHLLAAFFLGMFAMMAASGAANAAAGWVSEEWLRTGGEAARLFEAAVLAGLVEELAKWVILIAACYHWREFDEPLDGLVYGVALSLGFATLENFLYVSRLGLGVAWQRAVFAVPAHALFGGTMGYYTGRAKFQRGSAGRWPARIRSLALPVVFHGAYDYALAHRLDWMVWTAVTALSLGFWIFVLRRVYRAQRASPYRPKTMPPTMLSDPRFNRRK